MQFKDISKFSNIFDYLPILNGVLLVETFIIYFAIKGVFKSKYLTAWYKTYGLAAVMADVLIVMIGFILTRFFYSYFFTSFSIGFFILLALCIQVVHDIGFYAFFSLVPRDFNKMLDLFKDYAKEVGVGAIIGDSSIVFFSVIFASLYAGASLNLNIIYLIVTLYFIPYMLHA